MASCLDCPASSFQTLAGSTDCSLCPSAGVDLCYGGTLRAAANYWVGANTVGRCVEDRCLSSGACASGRAPAAENPLCGACAVGSPGLTPARPSRSNARASPLRRAQEGYAEWGLACVACRGISAGGVALFVFVSMALFALVVSFALRAKVRCARSTSAGLAWLQPRVRFAQNTTRSAVYFAQLALVLTELDRSAKPAFLNLLHLTLVDAIALCAGPISPATSALVNIFTPWLLGAAFLPPMWLLLRAVPRLQQVFSLPNRKARWRGADDVGACVIGVSIADTV
jgi:hypothetical protein